MTVSEILQIMCDEIHSTVFSTVDDNGLPQTCVIDIMLADDAGLYFLTAKGKSFYDRLLKRGYVAVSGMMGRDTLSTIAISVRGNVRSIGKKRLDEIFVKNPYMEKIYPATKQREALEVFQLYRGEGEYFDLSQHPPFRHPFSFGGDPQPQKGYYIDVNKCIGCQSCLTLCPSGCISLTAPRVIDSSHCIHCGNCLSACPVQAVLKL